MFIIHITYQVDLEKIEAHLEAHISYLNSYYEAGVFLTSGRKVPRNGGIILAKAKSLQELEDIVAKDPFNLHNLATYEIVEFVPTKAAKNLELLIEQ